MTNKEFVDKMDWEGGFMELLDYGISPEELEDPETARLWRESRKLHRELYRLGETMRNHLNSEDF